MEQVKTIREGVEKLLNIVKLENVPTWDIVYASGNDLYDKLILNGEEYPIFWWRYNSQQAGLKSHSVIIESVTAKLNLCTLRSEGLDRLIFREFDLAEWFMNSEVNYFNAFINNTSANILVTMKNENAVQMELGATLPNGSEDQGKHTIWGKKGMTGDRVISEKLVQQSLFVFTDNPSPKTYSDNAFLLYGLNRREVDITTTVYHMIKGDVDLNEWNLKAKKLAEYVRLAHVSNNEVRKVTASEVK